MKWETGGEDNEPRMEDNKLRVGGKRMLATRKLVHNFSEHRWWAHPDFYAKKARH